MEKIKEKLDAKKYFNGSCEFTDPKREKVFRDDYLLSQRSFTSLVFIFVGALYMLLVFFDTFLREDYENLALNIITRASILVICIGVAAVFAHTKNTKVISALTIITEVILALGLLALLFIKKDSGFIGLLPLMIIIEFAIAFTSYRWIHSVGLIGGAVILISAFAPLYFDDFSNSLATWLEGVLYLVVGGLIGIYISRVFHVQRRRQFIKELELEESSITDSLTKINNRFKFDSVLDLNIKKSSLTGNQFSLIMYDIDNFKTFNDKYGHLVGDKILISISNIVLDNIRKTDIFARWGGEEFILLLPDTNLKDAAVIAEKLRILIATNDVSVDLRLTVSLGVTVYEDGDTSDTIIRKVDSALYKAKKEGKNRVVVA